VKKRVVLTLMAAGFLFGMFWPYAILPK